MRPKFKKDHGKYFRYDKEGWLSVIWKKRAVSIIATGKYNREIFGGEPGDITMASEAGKEARKAIKYTRRLSNQEIRSKRKPRRKRGQMQDRSVSFRADQIHLSVGAVNEPSEFSIRG